jgi:NAD(P)-dependent dehydrogenase (short-subunit alcohol dehydrogenase family)
MIGWLPQGRKAGFVVASSLINGAGGNKKEATTSPDDAVFRPPADAIRLGVRSELPGHAAARQVFGQAHGRNGGDHPERLEHERVPPLTKIAAYSAAKAAISNFTQWLAVHMCQNYSTTSASTRSRRASS